MIPPFWNALSGLAADAAQRAGVLALQSTLLLALGLALGWLLRRRGAACASLIARATLLLTMGVLILSPAVSDHPAPLMVAAPPISITASASAAGAVSAPRWNPEAPPPAEKPFVEEPPVPWTRLPGMGAVAVIGVWLLGAVFLLARLLRAAMALSRLRQECDPVTRGPVVVAAAELCAFAGAPPIEIRAGDAIETPFLSGILRATLWIPASLESDPGSICLPAVLAHEREHWRRRDCAWLLASRIATALLWPQPLLWLLCRAMEQSSEDLCDQEALAAPGVVPREYADCLLKIAEARTVRPQALGVGVVSFRSTLGRRILQILDGAAHRVRVPAPLRAALILGLTAAAVVTLAAVAAQTDYGWRPEPGYARRFTLAARQGWSVEPVRYLPGNAQPRPLTPEARRAALQSSKELETACSTLGLSMEPGHGPPIELKRSLEALLAKDPHSAQIQYLLAAWFWQNGEQPQSRALLASALAAAPTILAGRVQYADGRPIAGYELGMGIGYPAPPGDSSQGEEMAFQTWPIWTDEDGCFYLPVYSAGCRWYGWADRSQNGLNGAPPSVTDRVKQTMSVAMPGYGRGWCSFRAKIGALPPLVARPYVEWGSETPPRGTYERPTSISGDHLRITWKSYPQASSYQMEILEAYHPRPNVTMGSSTPSEPSFEPLLQSSLFAAGSSERALEMRLNGRNPILHRRSIYTMTVSACGKDGILAKSQPFYFSPSQGLLPLPLRVTSLQGYLPSGVRIDRIEHKGNAIVVTGEGELSLRAWEALTQTRWFDLPLSKAGSGAADKGFQMEYGDGG
ncbi:hypothetical protein CCAX7_11260 [Capsulimonas corticalis]|uniref:Uncharacterized protein n=1 Tax=Capsulimonas corticalis TaxID=2219043 RepID=A0A402CUR9_9BACT|nr:M56 family metallopeptidase [Capsulimonas corticalis]BDI29075.1 hypothetical protein CCAX7_11260 [Capsulimonas corticalis]